MAKIAIISCKKIRDISCVSCIKCFKGVSEKAGEFARYEGEPIEVVALGDCGDCPGLVMPKMVLIHDMLKAYGREIDAIHFATCMVKASTTAKCPISLEEMAKKIEGKFGVPVTIGTHPW